MTCSEAPSRLARAGPAASMAIGVRVAVGARWYRTAAIRPGADPAALTGGAPHAHLSRLMYGKANRSSPEMSDGAPANHQ